MIDRHSLHPPGAAVLIVSVAVLAASAGAGALLYRLTAPAPGLYPTSQEPGSAPALAAAAKIPEQVPDVTLPGVDGVPRRLRDWRGQPLVINFWATWCEPCRREIPLLLALRRERSAQHLEVVGIAVDLLADVRKYVPSHGIDYPVLVGEQGGLAAANAFGMDTVLPFSVFVDRQGRVVTLKIGELHRDEANLILDRVHDVDDGALDLATARTRVADGLRRLSTLRAAARRGGGALD